MATKIVGNSGVIADVTSNRELQIRPTTTPANAGYVNAQSVNDAGAVLGTQYVKSPEISQDFRIRTGIDTILDYECFCYASQRQTKHWYRTSTLTMGLAANGLTTNTGNVTTTNAGVALNTHRYFPLFTASATYCEFNMTLNNTVAANIVLNFGLFQPGGANLYSPIDGCGFRWTAAGLFGFQNYNTNEYFTPAFNFTPILNVNYHFAMSVYQETIEFYINDVLYGILTTSAGYGQPFCAGSQPLCISHAHTAQGAAGNVLNAKFTSYCVSLADWNTSKPWHHQMAGMNFQANSVPDSVAEAAANYMNAVYPAYNAVIATTTPITDGTTSATGLGGRTQFALVASETNVERLVYVFQNPAPSAILSGRNLFILGVRVTSMVTTLLVSPVGGINAIHVDLCYGSTTKTNATAEAASFAATTKNYRKIPLGMMNWVGALSGGTLPGTAPVGTVSNDIDVKLQVPIIVNPSDWVAISIREIGCAAGGLISMGVLFDGYWE